MTRRALILFAHGARDPRWAEPFERLKKNVQAQAQDVLVSLAFLELMTPSLPDQVLQLVQGGCEEITIVPIFLGQGGHVRRDLPLLVESLRETHPQLRIKLETAAGEDADVLSAIGQYCLGTLSQG